MARAWMPLYIGDYLADTGHLSARDHGAYLLLIMHYWQNEGLPADDRKLARIAKVSFKEWSSLRETMQDFFSPEWKHERVEQELEKARTISSKRSASAKQKHSNSSANAEQVHTQSQSQSPSQEEKKEKGADAPNGNGSGKYEFEGSIIKLNEKNFSQWTASFKNLDVSAELLARDAWLASARATEEDRKNWFVSTASFLAKKNREAKVSMARATDPPEHRQDPRL